MLKEWGIEFKDQDQKREVIIKEIKKLPKKLNEQKKKARQEIDAMIDWINEEEG